MTQLTKYETVRMEQFFATEAVHSEKNFSKKWKKNQSYEKVWKKV